MRISVHTYDSRDGREDALRFIGLAREAITSAGQSGAIDLPLYLLDWARLEIEKDLGKVDPNAVPPALMKGRSTS